jgi:hypothetical protein
MNESALYYRLYNLLIKFDGLYWYWSPNETGWVLDQNLATEHLNKGNFIGISEEEVEKYILNSRRNSHSPLKIESQSK